MKSLLLAASLLLAQAPAPDIKIGEGLLCEKPDQIVDVFSGIESGLLLPEAIYRTNEKANYPACGVGMVKYQLGNKVKFLKMMDGTRFSIVEFHIHAVQFPDGGWFDIK